jgi:hypothetical protein
VRDAEVDLWHLKIAEAYYYTQCQISRIDYQLRPDHCDWRKEQILVLQNLQSKVKDVCIGISNSPGLGGKEERDHCLNSFATILRIARWTEGRLKLSVFKDVLPLEAERQVGSTELTAGIKCLQSDPWRELCESTPSLEKKAAWPSPARWLAMKYRYEARGCALRWIVNLASNTSLDVGDLIVAYRSIDLALNQTVGRDLGRQEMLNQLESARLRILVLFGERVVSRPQFAELRATPSTRATALHELNTAFLALERIETPARDQWHRLLAYRLASYCGLLAAPTQEDEFANVTSGALLAFLRLSPADMKAEVVKLYREFANNSGTSDLLDERIRNFEEVFEMVRKVMESIASFLKTA